MNKRKRNWPECNERLVIEGEAVMALDILDHWDEEVKRMNENKKGRPFQYPESFILFMAIIYIFFNLPYRQMEGFCRKLAEYIPQMKAADYTTLFRRIKSLNIDMFESISPSLDGRIVAVDSTGIKVTNRGEWMRHKWKVYRGWLKVHIIVDVETKEVIALEITTEEVSDNKVFDSLIESAEKRGENIKMVIADGAYDTRDIHNSLGKRGIISAIRMRKNSSTRSRGSPYRARNVRELLEIGIEEWKRRYRYGRRWAVESVFSVIKRMFGECVRGTSIEGMIKEIEMKFMLYNMFLNLKKNVHA